MRDIKFRIWNKSIYKDLLEFTIISLNDTGWINIKQETNGGIDQFTGLLDKNGKEIYEGDILKGYDAGKWGDTFTTQVKFEDGAFVVDACTGEFDRTAIGWAFNEGFDYEIIGNIYENKDL